MKKLTSLILAAVALFAVGSTARAQQAPKILVVNMEKIFNNHYKTIEQQGKLQAEGKKVQEQVDVFQKDITALGDEAKDIQERAKNPTISADAKDALAAQFQKKVDEYRQKRDELNQYYQQAREGLEQRKQAFKSVLVDEISHIALDIAKRRGATFLFDSSAVSLSQVPSMLYADPTLDITDDVIAQINSTRPPGSPTSAPSASVAPSSDSPSITVPSIPKN